MLSNIDLKKRISKGDIAVYPFVSGNIQDANMCVTASKYAWSIVKNDGKKRKYLFCEEDGRECIKIPTGQSALVFSQEALYTDKKLAGVCLPRVTLLIDGLVCTGGPIKPDRAEFLVFTMHNQTDHDIQIGVGDKIAALISKGLIPRPLGRESGGVGDMFPHRYIVQ